MASRSQGSLVPEERGNAAFETLFRTHYAPLCDYVCRYVGSPDVARDLVHDLFLKLWERADQPASTLATAYLYTAARNRAIQHLRHTRVEARWAERVGYEPPASASDTDAAVYERELQEALDRAVAEMPEQRRLVFTLSRHRQLSNAEIAAALNISVKTVEQHMWQALKSLRAKLAPHLFSFGGVIGAWEFLSRIA